MYSLQTVLYIGNIRTAKQLLVMLLLLLCIVPIHSKILQYPVVKSDLIEDERQYVKY